MTEAIKQQERILKKLFIFLSSTLALVFLTALFSPCDQVPGKKDKTVRINSVNTGSVADKNTKSSGCIFRDYLLTDRFFG